MKCNCETGLPVSMWWAEECCAQNHRAESHQLVCSLCGGGIEADDETQARVEHEDRGYERKQAAREKP